MASSIKRLYRSKTDRVLGGVCGGIAEYLGVDPVVVRLIWVIASLFWGVGILAYLLAWLIIPVKK
jgi:phage shock protein PspC (stress-responsive transcriptional regulator)